MLHWYSLPAHPPSFILAEDFKERKGPLLLQDVEIILTPQGHILQLLALSSLVCDATKGDLRSD